MAIMCLDCFEIYSADLVKYEAGANINFCPKNNCYGEIAEIDELLIPTIKVLNQKGYLTDYCCSAHAYEIHEASNTYISFSEGIMPPNIPIGFQLEGNGEDKYVIRKCYENISSEGSFFIEILKTAKTIFEWAMELPDNEELLELL